MDAKIKILYLEYIAGEAILINNVLKKARIECDIVSVNTRQNYIEALSGFVPHIILSDDALPDLSSIAALKLLKEKGLSIPLIVITTPSPDNMATEIVNIMKQGAFDYILKEHIQTLPDAVLCAIKKHKSDANLLLGEQRYRQIVETAQEGIWILDENMITIFVNKKMCDILGYSTDEIIGKYNYDFKDDADKADTLERFEKRKLGFVETHESTFISKTGKPIICTVATNGLFDSEDKYLGTLAMLTDITKRKADEEALKRSEASLRTIFNNTDMAYILLDNEKKIVSFNNFAEKFSKDQNIFSLVEGSSMLDCAEKDRRPVIFNILENTKNGPAVNYELSMELNSVVKWYDITWAGIKKDQGYEDFGHIFTSKDITEKKILEIEREKITTDLLQRNKALEQFTYIISHNLRAPVANIIGLSSLFAGHDMGNDDVGKIVSGINLSANKLDEVISDLNQVLQVNEGNENIESIILSKLVENIKSSIDYLIEKEHVVIIYDFKELDELLSLKSFIHSIFYNLILNSIKYRNANAEPVINISTKVSNGKMHIVFKDNGRGIDTSKYANEIFGLYKRFDTSVEGKGMGLFMVKMQVESLGGNISLQSTLNEGSEFTIEFPQIQLGKLLAK